MALCGVVKVSDLKTFKVGGGAVVIIKLHTRASLEATRMMKKALCSRLEEALRPLGFPETEAYVRFDWPSPEEHRIAFALAEGTTERLAGKLAAADRLRICDVKDGEIDRARDVACGRNPWQVVELLRGKRVVEVRVSGPGDPLEKRSCEAAGLRYVGLESDEPRLYGCDADDEST